MSFLTVVALTIIALAAIVAATILLLARLRQPSVLGQLRLQIARTIKRLAQRLMPPGPDRPPLSRFYDCHLDCDRCFYLRNSYLGISPPVTSCACSNCLADAHPPTHSPPTAPPQQQAYVCPLDCDRCFYLRNPSLGVPPAITFPCACPSCLLASPPCASLPSLPPSALLSDPSNRTHPESHPPGIVRYIPTQKPEHPHPGISLPVQAAVQDASHAFPSSPLATPPAPPTL
ncbi:hypothetical protein BOTBODRAFT_174904 [Botryobasidium botryosum FD-172 SS1]|uniref:Uncharacterized protein n=1 Tax=Botryobasidium botryosum (strain FD-172 SS1) TaxID=930990 RepID=A0A067MEW2_BOTB1|nr:hypothetical protein BOTBODRAFT_174904 [Botryobasidium botryosum FD-172 SS1]